MHKRILFRAFFKCIRIRLQTMSTMREIVRSPSSTAGSVVFVNDDEAHATRRRRYGYLRARLCLGTCCVSLVPVSLECARVCAFPSRSPGHARAVVSSSANPRVFGVLPSPSVSVTCGPLRNEEHSAVCNGSPDAFWRLRTRSGTFLRWTFNVTTRRSTYSRAISHFSYFFLSKHFSSAHRTRRNYFS